MNALGAVAVAIALGGQPQSNLLDQDFRNGQFRETVLNYFGPKAKQYITREAEGLRITLPAKAKPIPPVGVACKLAVHGDFEITVSYEVLQAEKPKAGYGLGPRLQIWAATAERDHATLGRASHSARGEVYTTDRASHPPESKDKHHVQRFPAVGKAGKLRFTRTGTTLIYSAAGAQGDVFQELRREPFTDQPLKSVLILADTGSAAAELDVRFQHLNITCQDLSATPPVVTGDSGWVWWLVGAACVLGAAVLAWFFLRRRTADNK